MNIPSLAQPVLKQASRLIVLTIVLSFSFISLSFAGTKEDVSINAEELKLATKTFKRYCAKCHGKEGKGDGRMNRIYLKLQVVTPTDFTIGFFEIRPAAYLRQIITEGGEKEGRSKYMPPFKDEISSAQIESLVKLIKVTGKMRKMPKSQVTTQRNF